MWAFWEITKSLFGSLIESQIGRLGLVALVAWLWGAHQANVKWEKYEAAQKAAIEAAYKAELARQAQAAKDIAETAAAKAEEDAAAASEMQKIIDDYAKQIGEKPNEITKIVNAPCIVDDGLINVVRRIDSLGRRAPHATRGSVKFR